MSTIAHRDGDSSIPTRRAMQILDRQARRTGLPEGELRPTVLYGISARNDVRGRSGRVRHPSKARRIIAPERRGRMPRRNTSKLLIRNDLFGVVEVAWQACRAGRSSDPLPDIVAAEAGRSERLCEGRLDDAVWPGRNREDRVLATAGRFGGADIHHVAVVPGIGTDRG